MTQEERQRKMDEGWVLKYGVWWAPVKVNGVPVCRRQDWAIEGAMYLGMMPDDDESQKGWLWKAPQFQGKAEHFKRFVDCIWGGDDDDSFEWNPWTERMLHLAVEEKFLAIAGAASSSKTTFVALWAAANYILRPTKTKIIMTSMTIQTAQGKVWGAMKKFWRRACQKMTIKDAKGNVLREGEKMLGGKLVDSMNIIKREGPDGTLYSTEGIELLPAEAGEFKKSAAKMQGYKSGYVFLLADELATLAPNILETARENLFANDNFQLIGTFNPDSHYDPGGILAEPLDGWDSIDENSEEWRTKFGGMCLRLDGMKSPNVLLGEKRWRGLMTVEKLAAFKELHPEKSTGFWKMVRGFWSPTGSMDCIYSEAEIEKPGCLRPVKAWVYPPVVVAGFDPAWTAGGDRAVAVFGRVGQAVLPEYLEPKIVWEHIETCILEDEALKKGEDKTVQIAEQFRRKCKEHGCETRNVALDVTGGQAFSSVLAGKIGSGFMTINFGGAASDLPAPPPDKGKKCRDVYRNMMTELWFSSKHLVRLGQIRNLPPATVVEMCARTYHSRDGRVTIEPKEDMKKRIKRSPDRSDSLFLSILVARRKYALMGKEKFPTGEKKLTSSIDPNDPLASRHDWAKPQKPKLEPDSFVASGGGWGYSGFGG